MTFFIMNDQRVYWLTGLSGSGKSTIAEAFRNQVMSQGKSVSILDGDTIRAKLHRHLDFSVEAIKENNRRIAQLCCEEMSEFDYVVVAVISPFRESRLVSREIIGNAYCEVYVRASLDAVKKRDPKGLYKKALAGEIPNFIGIAPEVPYEPPLTPDITLDTESMSVGECVGVLVSHSQDAVI
ncbi:MAG: adenylyl-sulfate kinase [Candidatus Omnitrophica bacterium]|nr:adenylyl-sulfate kinase [Candidatus Omnitrophota bacterium]